MIESLDSRTTIRSVIASELRLSPDVLRDDLEVETLGLDSLALAETVLAIETALGREVDPALLGPRLKPGMQLGELIDAVLAASREKGVAPS